MRIVITTKDDKTVIKDINALCVNFIHSKFALVDKNEDVKEAYDIDFDNIKSFTVIA